jgi:acyl-CoA thioesterase II
MGDLGADTRVEPGDEPGRYTAKLSADWNIWGPNGGYVASVALRAAGLATGRARPASIVAHFLGVAAFDLVDLDVEILKASRFATSARVRMRQDGRPILEALVWGVDGGGAGLEHDAAAAPDVPPVEAVPSFEERMAGVPAEERRPPTSFFDNIDQHPIDWLETFPPPGPADPRARAWVRFRPTPRFDDPWTDACRLVIPIDTFGWPTAFRAHAHLDPSPPVVAVTVDLSVRFHRPAADDWLLSEAVSPLAAGGLVAASGRLWDRAGVLVASGGQTMLCRPAG